jgi:hypothetical protein
MKVTSASGASLTGEDHSDLLNRSQRHADYSFATRGFSMRVAGAIAYKRVCRLPIFPHLDERTSIEY